MFYSDGVPFIYAVIPGKKQQPIFSPFDFHLKMDLPCLLEIIKLSHAILKSTFGLHHGWYKITNLFVIQNGFRNFDKRQNRQDLEWLLVSPNLLCDGSQY